MLNEFEWNNGDRETILNYYKLTKYYLGWEVYKRGEKCKGWRKIVWVNNWVGVTMAKGNIAIGSSGDFSPENGGATEKSKKIVGGIVLE